MPRVRDTHVHKHACKMNQTFSSNRKRKSEGRPETIDMFALWQPRMSFFRSSSFPTFALKTRSVAPGNRLSRLEKFQTGEREKHTYTCIRISLPPFWSENLIAGALSCRKVGSLSPFRMWRLLRSDFASRKLLIDGFCAVKFHGI